MTTAEKEIWFIYDGGCPLCHHAAHIVNIKQDYQKLHLVDARAEPDHPILLKTQSQGYDFDKGMVIYNGATFYHGAAALQFIAQYGTSRNIVMALCQKPFCNAFVSKCIYPFLRMIRAMLIRMRGLSPLKNTRKL